MTRLISALMLVGSFAFASSTALADSTSGNKNGFVTTTTTTQGGSTNTCNGNPGCTTTTTTENKGGNNQQPSTCDGPGGQCK
jgi:hypothetical protein